KKKKGKRCSIESKENNNNKKKAKTQIFRVSNNHNWFSSKKSFLLLNNKNEQGILNHWTRQNELLLLLKTFDERIGLKKVLEVWHKHKQVLSRVCMCVCRISADLSISEDVLSDILSFFLLLFVVIIVFNCNVFMNRSDEENIINAVRGINLEVLWNILIHPTKITSLQINGHVLAKKLSHRCQQQNANFDQALELLEYSLNEFGFDKDNDDACWYYCDEVQVLQLWKCYCTWSKFDRMY
ncbi:hypothetical protein RFI_17969, partial [Reticulomyxa filosa]